MIMTLMLTIPRLALGMVDNLPYGSLSLYSCANTPLIESVNSPKIIK